MSVKPSHLNAPDSQEQKSSDKLFAGVLGRGIASNPGPTPSPIFPAQEEDDLPNAMLAPPPNEPNNMLDVVLPWLISFWMWLKGLFAGQARVKERSL